MKTFSNIFLDINGQLTQSVMSQPSDVENSSVLSYFVPLMKSRITLLWQQFPLFGCNSSFVTHLLKGTQNSEPTVSSKSCCHELQIILQVNFSRFDVQRVPSKVLFLQNNCIYHKISPFQFLKILACPNFISEFVGSKNSLFYS